MCVRLHSILHMRQHCHPVAKELPSASSVTLFRVELVMLQDEYRQGTGSVVEVDYYNATSLLGLTDEQLIQRTLQTYLAACHPAYGLSRVQDSSILRSAWFCRPSVCCHGSCCQSISLSDKQVCLCHSLCLLLSFPATCTISRLELPMHLFMRLPVDLPKQLLMQSPVPVSLHLPVLTV